MITLGCRSVMQPSVCVGGGGQGMCTSRNAGHLGSPKIESRKGAGINSLVSMTSGHHWGLKGQS